MKTKSKFLKFLDNDIIRGNFKKIPQSVFDRISLIKKKANVARSKKKCI
jgi:hypothetical protein